MITLQCDNGSKMLTPETADKSAFLRKKRDPRTNIDCEGNHGFTYGYPPTIKLEENIEIVRKMCDFMIDRKIRFPANQKHWLDKWGISYNEYDLQFTPADIPKDARLIITARAKFFLYRVYDTFICSNGWRILLVDNNINRPGIASFGVDISKREITVTAQASMNKDGIFIRSAKFVDSILNTDDIRKYACNYSDLLEAVEYLESCCKK